MRNSADPDHLASEEANDMELHCLQRQPGSAGLGLRMSSIAVVAGILRIKEKLNQLTQQVTDRRIVHIA